MFIQLFAADLDGAVKVCDEARRLYTEVRASHPDELVRICVMREHEDMMRARCPDAAVEGIGPDMPAAHSMIGNLFRAAAAAVHAHTEDTVVVITDGNPTSRVLHSRFLDAIRAIKPGDARLRYANS